MLIDFRKWLTDKLKIGKISLSIKLAKVYLILNDDETYDFVIPMIYTKNGFLGLNIQHVEKEQRISIIKNISTVSVPKQKLKSYEMKKIKFITEITEKEHSMLEALPTKRGN